MCNLCACACQGEQLALAMQSVCEALSVNSYLSHVLDADSLLDGGAKPNVLSFSVRHEVRLANLLNLSI